MKINRLLRFAMTIAAVVIVLLIVNRVFFRPGEKDPSSGVDWANYEPDTSTLASATPTPSPSPTPTPSPTNLLDALMFIGNVTPSSGSTGAASSSSMVTSTPTASPTPTAKPTPTPTRKPTASPKPTATSSALRKGSEGSSVKAIQKRLKELGYLSGSADGIFGSSTESAVKAFQKANGLTADGVVGSATLSKLNSSSAKKASSSMEASSKATARPTLRSYTPSEPNNYRYLQLGSSGSDVTRLQKRLIELGYLSGSASGKYDEATRQAVIAFQGRNGEWVDGVAGEDTQAKLFSSDALAARR